jgi:hypothetical protein
MGKHVLALFWWMEHIVLTGRKIIWNNLELTQRHKTVSVTVMKSHPFHDVVGQSENRDGCGVRAA